MLRVAFRLLLVVVAALPAVARPLSVRDDSGRDVVLSQPASRIVSLAPHVTELLFEIGAERRIVGVTGYSDYPPAARALPRAGGLGNLDIERVVALRPDLVIAWSSGTSQAEFDALARLGVPVFRSEPRTLDAVASTLERLGTLTGRDREGRVAAAAFRGRVERLRERFGHLAPVRVFFQVWRDPLMTVGGSQIITQAIEACGGRNVFASSTMPSPVVDVEAVIKADPELIVTTATTDDHAADLAAWQRWSGVSAVRHDRYLFLSPDEITRQSSRVLIGMDRLCGAIDDVRHARRAADAS